VKVYSAAAAKSGFGTSAGRLSRVVGSEVLVTFWSRYEYERWKVKPWATLPTASSSGPRERISPCSTDLNWRLGSGTSTFVCVMLK
jgi:hypothetical protein